MDIQETIFAMSDSFNEEVATLMNEQPHLSLEEAQYLVTARRIQGYNTHVWL